jgi:hypothetical protein
MMGQLLQRSSLRCKTVRPAYGIIVALLSDVANQNVRLRGYDAAGESELHCDTPKHCS